jgi:hypothetical protein
LFTGGIFSLGLERNWLTIRLVFPGAGQDGKALFTVDSSAVGFVLVF